MEPKFVNRFIRSFEIEKEMYRYLYLYSPSIIICYVLLGIVLAADVILMITGGLAYAYMAIFAMCIIMLFVLFFRYYSAMQAGKKRFAEETNNKGEITVTAALTDDEFISESSDREKPVKVPYKQFLKLFTTEHYYMVQTTEKMVYVFKKGSFTTGREEEFLPYIERIISNNKQSQK